VISESKYRELGRRSCGGRSQTRLVFRSVKMPDAVTIFAEGTFEDQVRAQINRQLICALTSIM